jgi:PAS domain S-box-containing protein
MRLSPATRYAVAVLAAGLAVLLRFVFEPVWGPNVPFIAFFPAVMVSAWLGGMGPGLTTTLLCAAASVSLWLPPVFPLVSHVGHAVALAVFVVIGAIISGLNDVWRRASAAAVRAAEEFQVTIASIGDAVITTDDQGRVTLLNPVAEALTGWSGAEAIGQPVGEVLVLLDEASRRPVEHPVERVLRDSTAAGLANGTILLARDGREIPIDDSAAPIRTASGELVGVVIVFRDITRRRQSRLRQELQDAVTRALAGTETLEEVVPQILQLIGEGLGWDATALWTVDRDLDVLRCAGLWHRPAAKIESFAASTRQRTFPQGAGLPGRVWTTGEPVWLADAMAHEDLHRAWEAARAGIHGALFVPVLAGNAVAGVVEILSQERRPHDPDVVVILSSVASRLGQALERRSTEVERARLLAREQAARREAEAANRSKDEFLAMLSHELRTPLGTILGWTRLLLGRPDAADQVAKGLASIERNARLQARLIEDLLDVSRIASGKLTLETRPVQLGTVLDAALEGLRGPAEAAGVKLAVDIAPGLPPLVGDPARLQQVFSNLLSNAIKFTGPGGDVAVRVRQVGATLEVLVRDTGRGIRAEFLPHVFDRFRQDDPSTPQSPGGLGLGLTIARHLVEHHGGTVEAASPGEGQGATFTVRLPLGRRPGEASERSAPEAGRGASPSAGAPLEGVRVLVVDDDPDGRELLAVVLCDAGARVQGAGSVSEAREALNKDRGDVMISDISMAGEDGHALIRHVRATDAPGRRLLAVALTAHAGDEDRARALAAGFDGYISKPAEPSRLVELIALSLPRDQ